MSSLQVKSAIVHVRHALRGLTDKQQLDVLLDTNKNLRTIALASDEGIASAVVIASGEGADEDVWRTVFTSGYTSILDLVMRTALARYEDCTLDPPIVAFIQQYIANNLRLELSRENIENRENIDLLVKLAEQLVEGGVLQCVIERP